MIKTIPLRIAEELSVREAQVNAAIKLFEEKKVDPNKLVTKVVPLKDIQKTFEEFLEPGERKFIKIVVEI